MQQDTRPDPNALHKEGRSEPPPREEAPEQPVTQTQEKAKPARPRTPPPQTPGRGGEQHKRLQRAIQLLGHDRGYRVTIEKEILGGTGSVDVALEKDSLSIACEISVTTEAEHELGNIQKCLASGYDHVVMISGSRPALSKAQRAAKAAISNQDLMRVRFLTFEELTKFLDQLDAVAASTKQTVRGYKVTTNYTPVSEAEKKARKKVIAETILTALKQSQKLKS